MTKRFGWCCVTIALVLAGGTIFQAFAGSGAKRETTVASKSDSEMELSGEQLWSMNCQRCHNFRTPTMYSDAQWDVIVHHMRVRANLTGAEQRAILDFLKSAN
jgi:nitrate/TMAO reductase-like tetraheme cytochrome c subunit